MSNATLALDGVLAAATALLYIYVGSITLRRETSDGMSRRAVRLFALWWYALAALTLVGTMRTALAAFGVTDMTLHHALSWLSVLPLAAALWGLVSYLAFIYTGSPTAFRLSTLFHGALLVALAWLVAVRPPTGVVLGAYSAQLQYDSELPPAATAALLAGIILPALAAAVGYASLYFRTNDRSARYRIAMVSGAFVMWFGIAGFATPTGLNELAWWPVASRVVAFVATLMVLAAYQPPRWAREAFGLRAAAARPAPEHEPRLRLARATLLRFSGAS